MSTMEETLINVTTVTDVEEVIPLLRGEPKYWCVYTVMNIIIMLLGILISSHHVPIQFIMTQYFTHKKNKDQWYSSPFYTGPGGYKMCIRVDANDSDADTHGNGAGTHVSVFVYLMRGEYDSRLVWPFRGDITIQLVNHKYDHNHHEMTVPFSDAAVASGVSNRVTSGERADIGRGYPHFISHTVVESSNRTRRYIIINHLTFRVTKLVVHSV